MRAAPVLIRSAAETRAFLAGRGRVAFVPTMGALHEGHLSLARRARELAGARGTVAASVFVNPLQFGEGEDFAEYPRGLDSDLEKLRGLADVVFAPDDAEMYPRPQRFGISLPPFAGELEGRFRPGFFEGVAVAVCKLLNVVAADFAVFGAKDYQQAVLISEMARDFNFRAAIEIAPTVREGDGLAMSSRNAYLSAAERREAPRMFSELRAAALAVREGADFAGACARGAKVLRDNGWGMDYFEARNADDFSAPQRREATVILAAGRLGGTRLIDNVEVDWAGADSGSRT